MENVETIKGIWAVVAIFATGLVTCIGYLVKEHLDRKRIEKQYRDEQTQRVSEMSKKLDKVIEWQIDFATEQNKRLKKISEGLKLSMEDDKLIFQAFRKSELLNGDSEAQSKKLEKYEQSLIMDSFLFDKEDDDIEKLENLV